MKLNKSYCFCSNTIRNQNNANRYQIIINNYYKSIIIVFFPICQILYICLLFSIY